MTGYSLLSDYAEESPHARLIEAVAGSQVDVAIAWGPIAAYFARRQGIALEVSPVSPQVDLPVLPFVYDISIGVRRTEGVSRYEDTRAHTLRDELDAILRSRGDEIRRVLDAYGVPVLDG